MAVGASSGIGATVSRALAREGALVALAAGTRSLISTTDVTDREQVKTLVERAEKELGPVEFLVNCANVMYYTPMLFPSCPTPRA